jgi:signal peptidase I
MPILIINVILIIKTNLNKNQIADVMGYKPFIVLSGSMEKIINIGDLAITKNIDSKKIKIDDVIAFRKDNIVILHRVKEIHNDGDLLKFKTKGDNNNVADDFFVDSNLIEGVLYTKIPYLGSVLLFLSKPVGLIIIILVIIVISMGLYFINFRNSKIDIELMHEFEEFKRSKNLNNKK